MHIKQSQVHIERLSKRHSYLEQSDQRSCVR